MSEQITITQHVPYLARAILWMDLWQLVDSYLLVDATQSHTDVQYSS